jgi:hypothetical protein
MPRGSVRWTEHHVVQEHRHSNRGDYQQDDIFSGVLHEPSTNGTRARFPRPVYRVGRKGRSRVDAGLERRSCGHLRRRTRDSNVNRFPSKSAELWKPLSS